MLFHFLQFMMNFYRKPQNPDKHGRVDQESRRLSSFEQGTILGTSANDSRVRRQRSKNSPEVILLDGRDGVHLTNFTSNTLDLDTDVGSAFDDLISVVCELRRCRVAVEFDVGRNHLSI